MEEKYVVVKNGNYIRAIYDTPEKAQGSSKEYARLASHPNRTEYTAKAILVPKDSTIYMESYYGSYKVKTFSPHYKEKRSHLLKLVTKLDELKIRHGIKELEEEIETARKEAKAEVNVVELSSMFMKDL